MTPTLRQCGATAAADARQARDLILRRHPVRSAVAAAGLVFLFALGLYVFGNGRLGVAESLTLGAMLALSIALVVVGAWVRPAAFADRPWRRILVMVILATAGGAVGAYVAEPVEWAATMRRAGPAVVFGAAATGLVLASLATGLALLRRREIAATEARLRAESDARLREERLAHRAADARLAALQAQVEPHFLFNTLGAIVELAEPDSPRAATLGRYLVDFLRGSLGALRTGTTTLATDLELARAYLSVMVVRLGARFTFEIDATPRARDATLPSAMVISLVENAIKHGIEPWPEPAAIRITARVEGNRLVVCVDDTGRGLVASNTAGFGLANLRERLALQFGDRATLTLEPHVPRGTRACLRLPFEEAAG